MDNRDIKKIWEQGFLRQKTELSQHQINSIMERKSAHIIEKIKRTIDKDQKAMPYVVLAIVLPLLLLGYYKFGVFLIGVFAALYYLNIHMIKKLYAIEVKENTLQYLLSMRALFSYMKRYYTRLLGVGMPLIAMPVLLFSLDVAGVPLEKLFSPQNWWLGIGIMLAGAGLFSLGGILSYRLSTAALYGKDLKRIDELIDELSAGGAS